MTPIRSKNLVCALFLILVPAAACYAQDNALEKGYLFGAPDWEPVDITFDKPELIIDSTVIENL